MRSTDQRDCPTVAIGDSASIALNITDETIAGFAELCLDRNPMHLDEAYASRTKFGKRIAHGMISAGLISAVIGNKLPGPGTIYVSQTLEFKAPVFVGTTIVAKVKILEKMDKNLFRLETTVADDKGQLVVTGEAIVKNKTLGQASAF